MIYLKIDYIQSVILNEIRKNNSEKARESQLSKQHPNLQNEFCINNLSTFPYGSYSACEKIQNNKYIKLDQVINKSKKRNGSSMDLKAQDLTTITDNLKNIKYQKFSTGIYSSNYKRRVESRMNKSLGRYNSSYTYKDYLSKNKERVDTVSCMLNPNGFRSKSVSIQEDQNLANQNLNKGSDNKDSNLKRISLKFQPNYIKINQKDTNKAQSCDYTRQAKIEINLKTENDTIESLCTNDPMQPFEYEVNKQKESIYFQDKTRMLELLLREKNKEIMILKSKLEKFKLNYKLAYKILDSPLKYCGSTRKSRRFVKEVNPSPSQVSSFVYDSAKASAKKENTKLY